MSTTLITILASGLTLTGVYAYCANLLRKPAAASSQEG